jgi:hypothetical protein
MAEISIGSAVGAGFQLITRKPLTVMTWGLVRMAFAVAVVALYAPVIMSIVGEAMQTAQAQASNGGQPSQAQITQMMSHIMVMQGAGFLVQIGGLFVSAILFCAVSRAVIHPERGAVAYLRIGPPEFFTALISFAAGFVAAFVIILCMIPFAIAVGILASQKLFVAMAVVIGLMVLVMVAAIIYIVLRFAFVVPMMVDDGQFHLFDAWRLSKGHVGAMFVIGLCLVLVAIVIELLIGAVLVALGVAALAVAAGGLQNVQSLFALGPMAAASRLAPWLIIYALLGIPLSGCLQAVFLAPWARAYRDIRPPAEPVAVAPPATQPPTPLPPTPPPPPIEPSPAVA